MDDRTVGELCDLYGAYGAGHTDECDRESKRMCNLGLKASLAAASLRETLACICAPSETMKRVVIALGYSSGAHLLKERGVRGAVKAVVAANPGYYSIGAMFPNVRAQQFVHWVQQEWMRELFDGKA